MSRLDSRTTHTHTDQPSCEGTALRLETTGGWSPASTVTPRMNLITPVLINSLGDWCEALQWERG